MGSPGEQLWGKLTALLEQVGWCCAWEGEGQHKDIECCSPLFFFSEGEGWEVVFCQPLSRGGVLSQHMAVSAPVIICVKEENEPFLGGRVGIINGGLVSRYNRQLA